MLIAISIILLITLLIVLSISFQLSKIQKTVAKIEEWDTKVSEVDDTRV